MPPSDRRTGPTRRTPLALLIVAGALLVARVALGIWYEVHPAERPELVTWTSPPAPGRSTASGKPVLYVFTDDSPASRRAARELFSDPGAARAIESQFVPVRIEGSAGGRAGDDAELRARFGVERLPAFVVTSPDGGRFRKFSGYSNPQALMDSLSQARLEMMDLPFIRSRSFRFGTGPGPQGAPEPDSAGQRPGRSPR
jgi:hypothetical protein